MTSLLRFAAFLLLAIVLLGSTAAVAQPIPLTLPNTSGTVGDTITVPVTVGADLTGQNVLAYELAVNFRGDLLTVTDVSVAQTLSESFGSVEFSVERNGRFSSTLRIAAAGATPLSGTGPLVNVVFDLTRSGASSLSFDPDQTLFNEGTPELDLTDTGRVDVAAKPEISISPRGAQVLRGESQSFSASGGTAPYTWSVTNTAVASIGSDGVLTGQSPGTTRVVALDDAGIRDTSDVIQVVGYRLSVPDTSAFSGTTLNLPVYTTDLTGLGVTAGEFRLRGIDGSQLVVDDVVTAGTLLDGHTVTLGTATRSGLPIAFGSDTPLSGAGPLLILTVRLEAESRRLTLSFDDLLFNETLPGLGNSGSLTVDALPQLSVSPNGGALLAGESVDLTVQNTTGPVSWTVSNSSLASISSVGRLTALQGGSVTVTATDSIGATVTTRPFDLDDVTMGFPDTTARPNDTVRVPLRIGNLPAAVAPSALELDVRYPSSLLSVTGVENTGTQTEGWSYSFSDDGGALTVAGAGTTPMAANGTVLVLVFETADRTSDQRATLQIDRLVLNEGRPTARLDGSSQILITQSNRAPGFASLPATRTLTGTAYAATVTGSDPDGDAVSFTAPTRPNWLTVTDNGDGTATLSGTPPEVGFFDLTLSVSDGQLQTSRALVLAVYSSTTTVTLPSGDPALQSFPNIGLEFDLASLDAESDLFVGEQTAPRGDLLSLPGNQGLAVARLWTLDFAGPTPVFSATVCFDVTTLVNDVDPTKITVRKRSDATAAWSAPLATELRSDATDPTQICATDVRSFSDFVVTADEALLPVELADFSARRSGASVVLTWITASETNNAGFHVERAVDDGPFGPLQFVRGQGTTSNTSRYQLVDRPLPFHTERVVYRLRQVDLDGTATIGPEIAVAAGTPPALQLHETFPNPARGLITVRYELPEPGTTRLALYNLLGQRVQVVAAGPESAGRVEHTVDTSRLPTGTYFLRLETPQGHRTQRLAVIR